MGGYKKTFEEALEKTEQVDNTMKRIKLTEAMVATDSNYHKVNIKYAKKNGEIVSYTIMPIDITETVCIGIDTVTSDLKEFVLDRITEIVNG